MVTRYEPTTVFVGDFYTRDKVAKMVEQKGGRFILATDYNRLSDPGDNMARIFSELLLGDNLPLSLASEIKEHIAKWKEARK